MFQTELNLALQSLASSGLTLFMNAITWTGYENVGIGLLIILMAGVDFRKGFLLFQIMAWTGLISELLKSFCTLPRPFWVDSRVADLESGMPNQTHFTAMGARSFFTLPPAEVIQAFKGRAGSYGFPSGHVANAVALWGGLGVVFRKRFLYCILGVMTVLMAVSRMYLGRHFLADVLGGMVLGGLVLLAAWSLFDKRRWSDRLFESEHLHRPWSRSRSVSFLVLFVLPLPALWFPPRIASLAGYIMGLNGAYYLLMRKGIPDDSARVWTRAARVAVTAAIFFGATCILRLIAELSGLSDYSSVSGFFISGAAGLLAFWGGIETSRSLGWYRM